MKHLETVLNLSTEVFYIPNNAKKVNLDVTKNMESEIIQQLM